MTNVEIRMKKEKRFACFDYLRSSACIRGSFFIRHSDFDIRHFLLPSVVIFFVFE